MSTRMAIRIGFSLILKTHFNWVVVNVVELLKSNGLAVLFLVMVVLLPERVRGSMAIALAHFMKQRYLKAPANYPLISVYRLRPTGGTGPFLFAV